MASETNIAELIKYHEAELLKISLGLNYDNPELGNGTRAQMKFHQQKIFKLKEGNKNESA